MAVVSSEEMKHWVNNVKTGTGCYTNNVNENDIVDAFLEGDIEALIDLHQDYSDLKWYKHIRNGAYQKINLVQSNLMGTLLEAKVDLLWRVAKTDNVMFDAMFIRKLERELQKYGEVIIKFDVVNQILDYKFVHKDFEIIRDDFNSIVAIIMNKYAWINDKLYKLEQTYEDKLETNRLYVKASQLDGWREVNLSEGAEVFGVSEITVRYAKVPVHYFRNERCLKHVIPLVNTIDMNLSNMDYISLRGIPFMMLPRELAMKQISETTPDSVDEQNIEEQITDMRNFIIKNDFRGQDYQRPEFIQPDVNITMFKDEIDAFSTTAANTMGLADITVGAGSVNIGANTSAEAIREREQLSIRTKLSERNQRMEDLEKMFKELGEVVNIDISDEEENFDNDKAQFYYLLFTQGVIDRNMLLSIVKPYWNYQRHAELKQSTMTEQLLGLNYEPSNLPK